MKKVQSVAMFIVNATIAFLLPIIFFTLLASRSSGIVDVRAFGVKTGSMQPAVPVGAIVFAHRQVQYQKGDIITFTRGDVSVTHRVFAAVGKLHKSIYTTKGDANSTADSEPVPASSVIGRVVIMIPQMGKVTEFLKTIPGFMLCILLPAIYVVTIEFIAIKKELETLAKKKYEQVPT